MTATESSPSATEHVPPDVRRASRLATIREGSLVAVLVTLVVVFSVRSPLFLTYDNAVTILQASVVYGLLAAGLTLVILTGGIDLSFASVMAFSSVVVGWSNVTHGQPAIVAVVLGLLAGAVVGALNGLLVAYTKLQPFVVTLGTYSIAQSLALFVSGGGPIQGFSQGVLDIAAYRLAGIPSTVFVLLTVVVVLWVLTRATRFGRFVYATGGNERAALYAGVRVRRIKLAVYMISGLTAALAGVLNTSTLQVAQPQPGFDLLLIAIAAVVVGGASLTGGVGGIGGTVLGVALLGVLNNGLNVLTVEPFYQNFILGVVIIGSVLLNDFVRTRISVA